MGLCVYRGCLGTLCILCSGAPWCFDSVLIQRSGEQITKGQMTNFCSCPHRTQCLNSRCDLLTEIDMIISVRDCLQMDVNENQRLVLSRDVCDNHADRSSEKHSEVPKHLHSLLTCHTSSAH